MSPNITRFRSIIIYLCLLAELADTVLGAPPLLSFNGSTPVQVNPRENNIHKVDVPGQVIYEGHSYSHFYISKDGMIAFTDNSNDVRFHSQDWSAPNVSPYIDIPFLAPYYDEVQETGVTAGYKGQISYQELLPVRDQSSLLYLGQYIRSQVVGSGTFDPTWGMQVTWENVTTTSQFKAGCLLTSSSCPTNTFQLVLLTDGSQTYAIFNYGSMNVPTDTFSQAGFNGGHGVGWTNILPASANVRELNQLQGSDVPGRYIFRISSGQVFRGGCTKDISYRDLNVYPDNAGMFGGKMIDISGPCFTESNANNIMCSFGDLSPQAQAPAVIQNAVYVSQTRVRCMVPRLLIRDRITLSLSMNGGSSYPYSTALTIVFPGRLSMAEHVTMKYSVSDLGWYSHNPTTLTLTWNPALLSNNSNDRVDVQLIGYREANGVSSYKLLSTLANNLPVMSGSLSIDPQLFQCTQDCSDYEIGLVEVTLQQSATPQAYKFLSSKVIPLGWYVQNAMTTNYGTDWPSAMCVDWYNKDGLHTIWEQSLLNCPCSLQQAMSDFGRWQADVGCNLLNTAPSNCFYHKGAAHCVRAVQPVMGAGNQCCYGNKGELIFAADTFQGSTPDRSHDWGAAPYGKPGYVPSLSHWLDDVVSFYYCCMWTGYNSCDYYMDRRSTKDCTGYTSPVPAVVYGQGHVTPFGGMSDQYRMFGPGDYVLATAGNTIVQGKFESNPSKTENNATITSSVILTAVSVQTAGSSDKVELQLHSSEKKGDSPRIDVRVNGEYITFNQDSMAWQDFKGVAVVNTDIERRVMSNFTVMLTNNIGFQLAEMANTLQLDLMMPSNTFANISGLFGDLAGNFLLPNGSVLDRHDLQTSQSMYNNFQLAWAVPNKSSSLFQEFLQANISFLGPVDLSPTPMPGVIENDVNNLCRNNEQCKWDFRYTGSREIAASTLSAADRYTSLSHNLMPVRSCGLLNVPRANKDNYNYVLGTRTTLTGCRSGSMSGPSTFTCTATSNATQAWSPDVTATCTVPSVEDAEIGMIVGIVVAIVVVVIIAVVVAIIAVKRRRQHDDVDGKRRHGEMNEAELETNTTTTSAGQNPRSNEYTI